MKEIVISSVIVAFISSISVVTALCVVDARREHLARMAMESNNFDDYTFTLPDGCKFRPSDGLIEELDHVQRKSFA